MPSWTKMKVVAVLTALVLLVGGVGSGTYTALADEPSLAAEAKPAAVYLKVIYLLKKPSRGKDRPEPWIAKELTDRGHKHFMAVSGWVCLSDLNANKSTLIWNGASDWIDDGQQVVACPGFAQSLERGADGNVTVEIDAFLPVVNRVQLKAPDKLGARTLAMAVKDKIYVALQVGQPPEPPATQPD